MMKKLLPLALSSALLLSLAACGGGDADPATQASAEPSAPVEAEATEAPETGLTAQPVELGGTLENDCFKMSFDSVELADEYSYSTGEYSSTSLYVEEGYKLLMLMGHFENVGTSPIADTSFSFQVTVNGDYVVDGHDVRLNFVRDKYFEIDPYTDLDYQLYINIPEKLAEQYESVEFQIGFRNDLAPLTTTWESDGSKTVDMEQLYSLSYHVGDAAPTGTEPDAAEPDTEAEPADEAAEADVTVVAVGDTIHSDSWDVTLTKAEFASEIYPEDLSSSGNYYVQAEGSKFCNLEFDVKNLSSETLAFADAVNNVVVHCGQYAYDGYYMYYDMGGTMSILMVKGETHGPAPLDVTHLYVETDIPDEAVALNDTTIDLVIAGQSCQIKL